ncbi:sigma factor-like helix-turn-helix DNA-binding protein [Enorma phocaeensis]|uniref:sigma factor-like helix-turn-helix DNA-binding protein n=1 Tax=Enorma phocaeensis TaxID=1871019 RepID=UPI00320AB17C
MQSGSSPTEIKHQIRSILSAVDGPCPASFLSFQLPEVDFEKMESALLDMVRVGELRMGPEGVSLIPQASTGIACEVGVEPIVTSPHIDDGGDLSLEEGDDDHSNLFEGMSDQSIEKYFAQLFNEPCSSPQEKPEQTSPVTRTDESYERDGHDALAAEKGSDDGIPILFTTVVLRQDIPLQLAKYANGCGKRTWGQLLSCEIEDIRGVGKLALLRLESYLNQHALIRSSIPDWARSRVRRVGDTNYYFDQIGVLCSVPEGHLNSPQTKYSGLVASKEIESIPVEQLVLRKPTERLLRANGITTVGEILELGEEGLLSLRSFGLVKLREVYEAIEMLQPNAVERYPKDLQSCEAEDSTTEDDALLAESVKTVLDTLQNMEIPHYRPSMEGWLLTRKDLLLQGEASDESFVISTLISEGLDKEASTACASELAHWAQTVERGELDCSNWSRPFPKNKIWSDAVHSFFDNSKCFEIDDALQIVVYRPISVEDWLKQIEPTNRDANILRLRMEGCTLQEAGDAYGLTRERARQLVEKTLRHLPVFSEDRFLPLMQNYQVSQQEFCGISGCSSKAYHYIMLHSFKRRDRGNLPDAVNDTSLSEELRMAVRDYLHNRQLSNMVHIGGEYILKDRLSLVRHVLSSMTESGERSVAVEELYRVYKDFCIQNGIEKLPDLLPSSSRALFSWMQRQRCFMAPRSTAVRVYDFDLFDFSELENLWSDLSERNIECSTALIYRENPILMESLDIRDAYELYWISETLYQDVVEGVAFGPRMPMVTLGKADRYAQILSLIEELSPVPAGNLATEYERRYGVARASFLGSFLGEFSQYKEGNSYAVRRKSLTAEELDFLHDELSGADYRSLEFVRERFVGAYPDESLSAISDSTLRELALRYADDDYFISEGLIVRRDLDLSGTFQRLINCRDFFSEGDEGFGHDVFVHSAFRAELNKALRAFDVVQCMQDTYFSAIELERQFGIRKCDIKGYLEAVLEFAGEDAPFTIHSLNKQGFSHIAELLCEDDRFGDTPLESILSSGSGSKRFSTSSMGGKMVFCKTEKPFSTVSLLEAIVQREGELEIEELTDVLVDEYDIQVFPSYVRQAVQRTSLEYVPTLDMVFCTAGDYRAYIKRYLG